MLKTRQAYDLRAATSFGAARTHGLDATQQGQEAESTTSWSELPRRLEALRSCTVRGYRWEETEITTTCSATWALYGAVPCGTEVTSLRLVKQVHEGSKASSEEKCVTEVRSAVMEWCAAHPRPKDHVESGIWSVTRSSACGAKGIADQPKRQAKGNIKHALTAETPQLVQEKQIFLSKLPSDRRLRW